MERDRELALVGEVLAAARSGAGSTLLIEGPPGIGKTRLVASARALASSCDMCVVSARGTQLECDYAMGVVRQALEPAVRTAPDLDGLFTGAASLARSVVVEISEASQGPPGAVLHGLYWLVANLAERAPVLLAIDDVHWADEPSLRFLSYLARRVESLNVALVVAAREIDGAGGVAEVLAELRTDPSIEIVRPRPLGVSGVEVLIGEFAEGPVDDAFARACRDASGGNPFLLTELVRALRDERVPFTRAEAGRVGGFAPATVARRVRLTLSRIGADARALARAVAVLGEDVELAVAAQLAGVGVASASDAAGDLARAGVLDATLPLRFQHPLLAGAVRSDLSAAELAALHARAAALLRARGAEPERVALHLMHTTPAGDDRVVDELRAAASRARGRGAPATAAALLRRALGEPPAPSVRPQLLIELGRDEYAAGDTVSAARHFEEAHRSALDPVARGHALLGLFQSKAGNFGEQRALEPLFDPTLPEALAHDRELGLRLWTLKLLVIEPGPRWIEAARGVETLACQTPGEAILIGHAALPIGNRGTTGPELAAVAERAAMQADALLEEGATSLVMTGVVLGLQWADRLDTALSLLDRAISVARRRGAVADFSLAHHFRAAVHLRAGRLRDAEADAQTALAAATGAGWGGAGIGAIAPLLGSLIDQGRSDAAERELVALGQDGDVADSPALNPVLVQRMRLRAALGDEPGARADWEELRRRIDRHFSGIDPSWAPALLSAAECFHAFGELERRDALLAEASELAEHWGLPGYRGHARHVTALLAGGDDALTEIGEAVELLRASPARLELARALVSLGQVLRRRGRRVDSREPLREGYELARQCGAGGVAETARTELRASGIRLRREALTGADALTASERRIAESAAAGASNKEIAQALFLTVKTVESHLSNAYRKLDIPGRSQLANALAPKS